MMLIDLFILSLVLTTINAQNNCSRNENCTNILDCPEFRHLWKYPNEKFSEHTFQTIKRFKCSPEGNYPKVCCKQATETTEILEDTPDFPNVTNHPNLRLLDHQACGPNMNYGNKTKFFQYPWMALLRYLIYNPWDTFSKGSTEWILCSGTIISSRYILTAARCKYRSGFRVIGVRVGDYNLSKERECELDENGHEVCAERYQDIAMEKNGFYRHPDYSPFEDKNDIALIRLNDTIDFSPQNVKPICLPFGPTANIDFRRWILSGIQKVDVPGWGLTSDWLRHT
ncbi:serine protease easter [Monomorium pharaonis]|uniref:serine protease easter n=1 Tax=Monomorium pharaonis TaxID=307658 RepID=UPI00174710FB|nr:serine protease easter [Monomorium pharaonis]